MSVLPLTVRESRSMSRTTFCDETEKLGVGGGGPGASVKAAGGMLSAPAARSHQEGSSAAGL